MFRFLGILGLSLLVSVSSFAFTDEECEQLLVEAESAPTASVYTACGFDDSLKAWNTWAPFAAAHNMKHALFELCHRYPTHQYGMLYCQKAIDLNYGPALAYFGDIQFNNGNEKKAIDYYSQAASAGDLSAEALKEIREKIGFLYLKPDTEFSNPRDGIALLTRVALHDRSAVANNMLGYLIFTGKHGLAQDLDKALDFFWRAALVGCPAAEENIGLLYLAKQGQITTEDAMYYMSLQSDTCEPVNVKALPATVKHPVIVQPYHLTFTKNECEEIDYFAKRLVDINLPYTGKKECAPPELGEATKSLLGLTQPSVQPTISLPPNQ